MILVDSSVWIDHLRAGEPGLVELLNSNNAGASFYRRRVGVRQPEKPQNGFISVARLANDTDRHR